MTPRRHRYGAFAAAACAAALATAGAAPAAFAWGPAVHLRECARVADLLAAGGGPFAAAAAPAHARALRLGCLAPDFRSATPLLAQVQTHDWTFGRALVLAAAAPDAPAGALAFAVGALAHHASDGAESFFATALTAAALVGGIDVLPGTNDHAFGECELWVEALGEFANGDLDALVAVLDDLGAFGPTPWAWQPLLQWYVAQANAWHGATMADPAAVVAALTALLDKVKVKTAPIGKEAVAALLAAIQPNPPAQNVLVIANLPLGEALAMFGIDQAKGLDPVRWMPVRTRPFFADLSLWHTLYANDFQLLAPTWTLALLAGPKVDPSWPPSHHAKAMQAGIRLSLAHGMPATAMTPQADLIPDDGGFYAMSGAPITHWQPGDGPVRARVRVFAVRPVQTWLALRVHAVAAGVETAGLAAPLTVTTAALTFVPAQAIGGDVPKWVEVLVDPTAALGKTRALVLALSRGEDASAATAAKPFWHGDWRQYVAHNALDVGPPVHHPHQDDVAGWPRALQLPALAAGPGGAIVRVREAPAGNLIPSPRGRLRASADGPDLRVIHGTIGGRILLDDLPATPRWLAIEAGAGGQLAALGADGWPQAAGLPLAVTPGAVATPEALVWVVPQPHAAALSWQPAGPPPTTGTVTLRWQLAKLAHVGAQAMRWELRGVDVGGSTWWNGVVAAKQATDAAPAPASLQYEAEIPAEAVAAGCRDQGGAPQAAWSLQVRAVYDDSKGAPAPQAPRGPWAATPVAWPAAVEPSDGGGDLDGSGEDGGGDAMAEVGGADEVAVGEVPLVDGVADAAGADAVEAFGARERGADGCGSARARRGGAATSVLAVFAVLALAVLALAVARRRRARWGGLIVAGGRRRCRASGAQAPTHAPASQADDPPHQAPSARGLWTHPACGSQPSTVQGSPSSQSWAALPAQPPLTAAGVPQASR